MQVLLKLVVKDDLEVTLPTPNRFEFEASKDYSVSKQTKEEFPACLQVRCQPRRAGGKTGCK